MVMQPKEGDEAERRDLATGAVSSGVDRRSFLATATAGTALGLAGCLGGDDDDDDGNGDDDMSFPDDPGFRIAVDPGPNYVISLVAEEEGFWEDQGIEPLSVEGGQGSGDTARRIATNEDSIGMGAVTPQILGTAQDDYDIKQVGMCKFWAQSGLIYREDSIPDPYDPDDLGGATITAPDTLDEQMFEIFRQGIDAPDNVTVEYAEGATAASMLDQGDIDGIWDSINDYGSLSEELDHDLGFAPLVSIERMAGYPLIVNGSWVEEQENGVEYVRRVMQGYSEAAKWTLLNPEDALDVVVDRVPAIETQSREANLQSMAAGVAALNFADDVRENGFGYINEEILENSIEVIDDTYLEEDDEAPSVDDMVLREAVEDVELAQFDDDEWEQVGEFAGEFADFFE